MTGNLGLLYGEVQMNRLTFYNGAGKTKGKAGLKGLVNLPALGETFVAGLSKYTALLEPACLRGMRVLPTWKLLKFLQI